MSNLVVLDDSEGLCQAGIGGDRYPTSVVPNRVGCRSASKKWLVADQIQACEDLTSATLRRPFDCGYLINPGLQKEVWDWIFCSLLHVDPAALSLLLVEHLFNIPSIQHAIVELVFEGFRPSLYVFDGLISKAQCSSDVDSGFSFTHVAPVEGRR